MLDFIKSLFGGKPDTRFGTLTSEEFEQGIRNTPKSMLIDVRHKHEFDGEKIRNAMNLDVRMPNFKEKVSNLDKNKTYFLYCQSGRRSAKACSIMADMGFEKLYHLKGGILAFEGKTV